VITSNKPKDKEADQKKIEGERSNQQSDHSVPSIADRDTSVLPNLISFSAESQLFFSDKDTFPLLQTLRLDEDLKPFYSVTKEVPIGVSNGSI